MPPRTRHQSNFSERVFPLVVVVIWLPPTTNILYQKPLVEVEKCILKWPLLPHYIDGIDIKFTGYPGCLFILGKSEHPTLDIILPLGWRPHSRAIVVLTGFIILTIIITILFK